MSFTTIRIETDERGVARLTLARPDKHNAMSGEMIAELAQAAATLAVDAGVRVVVLEGEGPSFCAGGDLGWMRAQMSATAEARAAEARRLAHALKALDTLPKPLIGRVHGNAFGGGLGLMSVCDVAIAAQGARFGLTEVRLGLIPATISPYVIARMGPGRARRVFFSGRLFDAEEARDLGLVARVVAPDELDAAIEAEVAPYLAAAPGAVAAAKKLVADLAPPIDEAVIEDTVGRLVACWDGEEAPEGIAAFFARQAAPWVVKG